jgi:ferredoxin
VKIRVAVERCCGHARCATVAPHIFIPNESGYLDTPEIDIPPGQEALAKRGARACPERCISAVEEQELAQPRMDT